MKYKKYLIVAAALTMICLASVAPAMAYFTDSKEAKGRVQVVIGDSELIPEEGVEEMTKYISIANNSKYDAFIRVRAIYGSNYTVTLTDAAKENGWREAKEGEDKDYFYYDPVVKGKTDDGVDSTKQLILDIAAKEKIADKFNVVIIEEACKVVYDADGNACADWTDTVISEDEYETSIKDVTGGDQ